MRVAVIAGTPVDTKMGVDYIERKNAETGSQICEPVYLPAASDCDTQIRFQYSDYSEKKRLIDSLFDPEIEKGTRDFFIYCNSLSGAFDFDAYSIEKNAELKANAQEKLKEKADDENGAKAVAQSEGAEEKSTGEEHKQIRIFTPLQVYRELGPKYKCLGVMAANNLSTHAIEEALMSTNLGIYVIGSGNMSVVRAIEDGKSPSGIIEEYGLADMCSYMKASGAEALLLGCTHFPYFKNELSEYTELPIIDPADEMYERMISI